MYPQRRPLPENFSIGLSSPVERPSAPGDVTGFTLTWPMPMTAGDCTLRSGVTSTPNTGPSIDIFSDGAAEFFGKVSSSDPGSGGDVWLATIRLFDNHGVQLFQFPQIQSPSIQVKDSDTVWLTQTFYPAVYFPFIHHATIENHC
jgi:hypothetical protein